MCTVTWAHREDGYSLFFNRDELRARAPEHPPRAWNSRGVAVLAPLDGPGGGTWIAANEHGLTAALLNHTCEAKAPERPQSRGEVPLLAACHRGIDEALGWARGFTTTPFRPFLLALVDATGGSALIEWDGSTLSVSRDVRLPVTTSTFRPEVVARARARRFRELVPEGAAVSPGVLDAFHRSRSPEGGAWSVWMDRPDACTRSLVRVDVSPAEVTMRYEIAHPGFTVADSPEVAKLLRKPGAVAGNSGGAGR